MSLTTRIKLLRARMRAARAAALGMTLAGYNAYCAREQSKLDAFGRLYADRDACHAVIARRVAERGNTWSVTP